MTPKQQRFVQDNMRAEFERIHTAGHFSAAQERVLERVRLEAAIDAITGLHNICENGTVGNIDRAACKAWRKGPTET